MRLAPFIFVAILAACGGTVDAQPATQVDAATQPTEPQLGATCTCDGASCKVAACGDGLFCKVSVYSTDGKGICTRACGSRGQRDNAGQPSCPADFQCTYSMDNDQQSSVDYCFSLRAR